MGIFRKKNQEPDNQSDDEFDEEEEQRPLILFQGATNGKNANIAAYARLAEAGLIPAKELVTDGVLRRAELVKLDVKGERALINFQIDGLNYKGHRLSKQHAAAITQMLKLLSGLDVKERAKPQRGGIRAEFEEKKYEVEVVTKPVGKGVERLQLNIKDLAISLETPDDLGFSAEFKGKVRSATESKGLVIACGPPGSGTTTTAMAMLRCIDGYVYSVFTIADMMGRDIANVVPFEVNEGDELPQTIARLVRNEADVVFIDPLRSPEMAKTVLELSRQVTFMAELNAKDSIHAIHQLIKASGDPEMVSERVNCIVTQKLVRKLCEGCKMAFRPNPKILEKVGLPVETRVLYHPPPKPTGDEEDEEVPEQCTECLGLGYRGRVGMYEFIEFTDELRAAIQQGSSANDLKAIVKKARMQTLQRDGIRLVGEGKTSLEELQRVFRSKK